MKKILFYIITAIVFFTFNNAYAKSFSFATWAHLNVFNDWTSPIRVKEGYLFKSDNTIMPGASRGGWLMSYYINDLSISYQDNGTWKQIPGCSRGAYSYVTLNVFVIPDPANPRMPKCERELYPVVATSD